MNIISLSDLMQIPYPEHEYIVHRLVPDSSITILSGQSRSFKTYCLLQIALDVANGTYLFDTYPTKQAPVLIIDEENGKRLLQDRLNQLGAGDDLPVHFMSFEGFHLDKAHIEEVLAFCAANEVKLVIIDALIRVHSSDENSAREMSKVFQKLREFTKNEIAVLVTQHHRKQGANSSGGSNEMRGSSDILAAVDSHVAVTRKDTYYLTFTQEKQRYAFELEPFQVKVHADGNSFRFEHLGALRKPADKSTALYTIVCNLLSEHGELASKQLLDKVNETNVKTYRQELSGLLKRWVAEGALPEPKIVNGNTHLYWIEVPDNE